MNLKRSQGYTLVEAVIALAVASIVMGGAYSVLDSQRKAATTQAQVMDMQQNLRLAMHYMVRDIRLAGFPRNSDPRDARSGPVGGTGIIEAAAGHIMIGMDIFDGMDNDIPPNGQIDEYEEDASSHAGDPAFRDGLVNVPGVLNELIEYGFAHPTYDADRNGTVGATDSPPGTAP